MKRFPLLLASLTSLLFLSQLNGQQIYQSSDFGQPGTLYLYNRLFNYSSTDSLVQPGPDQVWDLSQTEVLTHTSKILSKDKAFDFFTFLTICSFGGNSGTECLNIWNATDQAWLINDTLHLLGYELTGLQRYQRLTKSLLLETFLGFTSNITGSDVQAVVVYNHPDTILHFPVIYGDQFTSSINWSIDLSPAGQDIQFYSDQSRTTSIDAWGDLITPLQTFENVIRMRSVIRRHDILTMDTTTIPIDITQVEYMWLDTAYKLPVMVANGIVTDSNEIINSIEYLWDKTCAAPTWQASINSDTYYIDSTGAATVEFTITNGNADEYTWDWGDGQFTTTTGSTTHTYTEPGFYTVGLTACMTNCLPLNSCSYDILEFEVLTGLSPIEGETVGIKIYPNPLSGVLNFFVPEVYASSHFQIVNMNGDLIASGRTHTGQNKILANSWSPGMYVLQVISDNETTPRFYNRFMVGK